MSRKPASKPALDIGRTVLRIYGGKPVEPLRFLTPDEAKAERERFPTGNQLADEIEAMLEKRPDISRQRFGTLIDGCTTAINNLRKRAHPRPKTVLKVRALIADPPDECLKRAHPRANPNSPRRTYAQASITLEEHQRRQAIRFRRKENSERELAQARIDAGLAWHTAPSAHRRIIQRKLEESQAELARQKDPVEVALTTLRRARRIVFRASVYGGPHDRFVLDGKGKQTISERDLLKMARASA